MSGPPLSEERLGTLQRQTFEYLRRESNPAQRLGGGQDAAGSPASIAAVGMALAAYPIGVERAVHRARRGARSGRSRRCASSGTARRDRSRTRPATKASTITSSTCRPGGGCGIASSPRSIPRSCSPVCWPPLAYFDADSADEQEIRTLADALYRRADWEWARNGAATVTHGWTPERGFIPYRWEGYDEALLLYVLGLGSPTHPLPAESYPAWLSTYVWKKVYDYELVYAGPLFIHQLSHVWIDFRGIRDAFMRDKGIDYFENSRRATYVQQRYAIENPLEFEGYDESCWGITASDGPGWADAPDRGSERRFFGYLARGAPYGPDDGTISPWAAVASLPFAPEIVLPVLRAVRGHRPASRPSVRVQGQLQPDLSHRVRSRRTAGCRRFISGSTRDRSS